MSLEKTVGRINDAIAVVRRIGVNKLLVETRLVRGFDPPGVAARFWFARKWADTAQGLVDLAIIARPEMIDPEKFGVLVARNRGTTANIFESEAQAAAWLYSKRQASKRSITTVSHWN
jgi:hypothetical protein